MYTQYRGAPMGRRGTTSAEPKDAPRKFEMQRVRINAGGYDNGGAYWGIGQPLYRAYCHATDDMRYVRARDRDDAKGKIRAEFPNATFHR